MEGLQFEPFGPAAKKIPPIEIPEGHMVYVYGLPLDLTVGEARKIANIIIAFGEEKA